MSFLLLRLFTFSYSNGMSFMASMTSIKEDALTQAVTKIHIQKSPSSGLKNNRDQPLCQWGEVAGHPGLITAFLQASNNPVVIMVRPDGLNVQEIKIGSKAKIVDLVAIVKAIINNVTDVIIIVTVIIIHVTSFHLKAPF